MRRPSGEKATEWTAGGVGLVRPQLPASPDIPPSGGSVLTPCQHTRTVGGENGLASGPGMSLKPPQFTTLSDRPKVGLLVSAASQQESAVRGERCRIQFPGIAPIGHQLCRWPCSTTWRSPRHPRSEPTDCPGEKRAQVTDLVFNRRSDLPVAASQMMVIASPHFSRSLPLVNRRRPSAENSPEQITGPCPENRCNCLPESFQSTASPKPDPVTI